MPPVPAERAVERGGEHYNHPYQQQQRAAAAADYTQALQPITSSQSTKILKELAPQLLHPRILTSQAFLNGPSSSSSSNSNSNNSSSSSGKSSAADLLSLSNPRNAFIALARLSGVSSSSNTLTLASRASKTSSTSSKIGLSDSTTLVVGGSSTSKGRNSTARSSSRNNNKTITSTDLRIIEDVDRLLNLPIPSTSTSTSVSKRSSSGLPTLQEEEDDDETASDMVEQEEVVNLLDGFNATIPSSKLRKLSRRKRRAILSEKQLGITIGINELGLKERGDRATRGLLLSDNDAYTIESIESTPKKRVIKSKRRSSFMPTPLRSTSNPIYKSNNSSVIPEGGGSEVISSTSTKAIKEKNVNNNKEKGKGEGEEEVEEEELLTKPELENEIKEINLDKENLNIRRKLTMKDLEILEEKIKKLEILKDELGNRLLELKEEELELDDELEGVQDRLAQLEARQSGKIISSTSSRRRKGPAFLPSEHDQLPLNVAFMTLTSRNPKISSTTTTSSSFSPTSVTSLDFSEPYGLLVASYSLPLGSNLSTQSSDISSQYNNNNNNSSISRGGIQNGQVSVYDLTDGEELTRLNGHKGIVKALLVEGDMAITGGEDGKIALWDLTTAVEQGLPEDEIEPSHNDNDDDDNTANNARTGSSKSNFVGAGTRLEEEEEDVFFSSRPSSSSGRRPNGLNGTLSYEEEKEKRIDDDDDFPLLPSPKPMNSQLPSSSGIDVNDEPTASPARMRVLEGHSKAVTCLSYENTSLVSGSSDKTLRLWDLNTGQCVVTMDILWAISNPLPADADMEETVGPVKSDLSKSMNDLPLSPAQYAAAHDTADYPWNAASSPAYMTPRTKKTSLSGLRRLSSQAYGLSTLAGSLPNSPSTPTASLSNFNFTQATPPYSDGSWETYSDFVGGLQLWSYALASGSADGCVRMWDTRTGQSVRSLIGHTNAITCLQFDNLHLVSGSLDKTVRVWDLRTGKTIETLRYEGPVTSLQFDSRRILVAGGTNNVKIFNRTTLQQTELSINGHTSPVERLRFMDKYLATGARDSTVKIWSLS